MSLWTHGDDREVYRAQHLFCYGAEEQLAYFAPTPSSEKDTIRFELARSCDDLLCWIAFADNGIAGTFYAKRFAPNGAVRCAKAHGSG